MKEAFKYTALFTVTAGTAVGAYYALSYSINQLNISNVAQSNFSADCAPLPDDFTACCIWRSNFQNNYTCQNFPFYNETIECLSLVSKICTSPTTIRNLYLGSVAVVASISSACFATEELICNPPSCESADEPESVSVNEESALITNNTEKSSYLKTSYLMAKLSKFCGSSKKSPEFQPVNINQEPVEEINSGCCI